MIGRRSHGSARAVHPTSEHQSPSHHNQTRHGRQTRLDKVTESDPRRRSPVERTTRVGTVCRLGAAHPQISGSSQKRGCAGFRVLDITGMCAAGSARDRTLTLTTVSRSGELIVMWRPCLVHASVAVIDGSGHSSRECRLQSLIIDVSTRRTVLSNPRAGQESSNDVIPGLGSRLARKETSPSSRPPVLRRCCSPPVVAEEILVIVAPSEDAMLNSTWSI